jgi:glycosyltransferase involved in cell wall biosynthesis
MSIKISVVIPTYKRPLLLNRCLEALQKQSIPWQQYEIIVVSDGRDHETLAAVDPYTRLNRNIHYYSLPEKKGPAAARNFGWKKASAELIAFTDDDTIPDKDWLKNYLLKYNGEELIAYTGIVKVPLDKDPTDYEMNVAGLETADFVTANCCCTKKALIKTWGFDERFYMAWREDSDLEFRLISCEIPVIYKVDAMVLHPARKAQWGVSIREQRKSMFNALLYKKYPGLYRERIQKGPNWDYYIMSLSLLVMIAGMIMDNSLLIWPATIAWLLFTVKFIWKRLRSTSKKPDHVIEMVLTSLIIPFTSIYWRLYGAWKFRVLFF